MSGVYAVSAEATDCPESFSYIGASMRLPCLQACRVVVVFWDENKDDVYRGDGCCNERTLYDCLHTSFTSVSLNQVNYLIFVFRRPLCPN